jgi:myo-inositol-1(or 4)-monophosphatase
VNPLLHTALAAADAAAAVHRRDAGRVTLRGATEKARADYVSQTDLDAQAAALALIAERHPDHAVLAEEGEGGEGGEGGAEEQIAAWDGRPLWIVDPLDGTANFLHDHPLYCASVAVAVEGRVVAGAVASGSSGERWWAADGEGAFKGGRRIRVSHRTRLRDALVGTGFPFKALELLPDYLGQLDRVLHAASGVRRGGSAALDMCYLAQGTLDAFWEEILMPWDFAAGIVLVREAGGVLARPDGSELDIAPGRVRGGNSLEILAELRQVLGEV